MSEYVAQKKSDVWKREKEKQGEVQGLTLCGQWNLPA